jgi:uncharacterized protein
LALALYAQNGEVPEELAKEYINTELGVETVEDALAGASDIIAEMISDDANIRKALREKMERNAVITVQATDEEQDSVYRLYYQFMFNTIEITTNNTARTFVISSSLPSMERPLFLLQ